MHVPGKDGNRMTGSSAGDPLLGPRGQGTGPRRTEPAAPRGALPPQTVKDSPQPQLDFTLGFWIWKPALVRPSE